MPDSRTMLLKQSEFHDMLEDIHGDREGFVEYVGERRTEMVEGAEGDGGGGEVDLKGEKGGVLRGRGLEGIVVGEAVGKGRFSTVFRCRVKSEEEYFKGKGADCCDGNDNDSKGNDINDSNINDNNINDSNINDSNINDSNINDSSTMALKKVSVLLPPSSLTSSPKSILTKCLKEVGLLRNLSHPNIVQYTDCFLHGNSLCILLEWCGGGISRDTLPGSNREEGGSENVTYGRTSPRSARPCGTCTRTA